MKNFFALALASVMITGFVSCGPSAEEKKKDSLEVDSTAKGMKSDADRMADSMEQQMKMQATQDSIHNAKMKDSLRQDSMNKAKSGSSKKKGK